MAPFLSPVNIKYLKIELCKNNNYNIFFIFLIFYIITYIKNKKQENQQGCVRGIKSGIIHLANLTL